MLPNGQYGARDQGGKDHASARYIFTEPAPITRTIFHPADDPLHNYLKEDNDQIEPKWYMSVIPLVLVNGAEGIGTGWSTPVPSYNPKEVVANIRRLMAGEEQEPMLPWWRGFKGTIKTGEHKYDVTGIARKTSDTTIEITIHKWTQTYKADLEAMIGEKGDGAVKDYKEHHDNVNVHFIISMAAKDVDMSNMICFDFDWQDQELQLARGDHRRVLPKAVGVLSETQGLPREQAAITVREAVEPGAFREDDRQQGVGGLRPQKGGHRRRITAEEVPAVP